MARSEWVRWGGLAALGAGALAILYFLLSLATGKGDQPGPLDILDILAMVLEVIALLGFHALQGRNYGRVGRAGLYITIGTIVVFEFLILAYLFLGDVGIEWLVPVGVLGSLVGLVLYGAATLQARVFSRWCGILFFVFMPVGLHACWPTIRGLTTNMGWTSVGGAGVRTALAQQRRSSPTTFARKVNPVSENDVWQMLGEQRLPAHRLTSPLFTVIATVGATYRWLRLRR